MKDLLYRKKDDPAEHVKDHMHRKVWDEKEAEDCFSFYLNTVLQAVQLPASIADRNACLTDVDRNVLSHGKGEEEVETVEVDCA